MVDRAADATPEDWWPRVFSLRQVAADTYQAEPTRSGLPRLYGGQVGAQSLLAAAATVDSDRVVHSVHTSFLNAGDDTRAVTYEVNRVRHSRSMSTSVVTAQQGGRVLASTVASFHAAPSKEAPPPIEHEWPATEGTPTEPPPNPEALMRRFLSPCPAGT